MAIEEMFTSLPTVSASTMADIICAVQGYTSPSSLGLSTQQTLQQVFNLFQSNVILFNSGNPNGLVAGTTYQFLWDTADSILWICTTSGTTTTAVWTRANINSGYATTATAAATTTLTIQSFYWQFFTGSTTQTVVMPTESTLEPGMTWSIVNNSTAAVTIRSSGLNNIVLLGAGESALVTCILNTGTTAASWNAIVSAVGGGVTSITGTVHQIIASSSTGAVTLSLPQSIDTTSAPTFAGLTLTAPLTIPNGGTGVNTVTTAPIASAFAGWDANKNMSANSFIEGYTTIATSAGTTTLTVASPYLNYFTGTTTQTVVLPVTSTLVLGQQFFIANNSTGVVTVQSSGLNNIVAMAANTVANFTVISTSGTTAASWSTDYNATVAGVNSVTGTANQVIASPSTGAVVLSLPQNINTAATPTFAGLTLTTPYIAGSGGVHSFQVFTTGTAQTYTKPSNVTSILIEIVGGGGAGGSSLGGAGAVSAGSGGGSGGYARLFVASASATYTYTVGAGGTPGAAGNNAGGNGGTSTFSASSLQATGGNGGIGMASIAAASTMIVAGSTGGIGTNGNINSNGGAGIASFAIVGNPLSGKGGDSHYSGGGAGLAASSAGLAGTAYGAGGSGSVSGTTSAQGGAGAAGLIIVWEFA